VVFVVLFFSDATTFKVPNMGDSISEGSIQSWRKNPGDNVAMDDLLALIETDKITVEIRATQAGRFGSQLAKEGDVVKVGQDLYTIEVGTGAASSAAAPAPSAAAAPKTEKAAAAPSGKPVVIKVPSMGDSITQGAIGEFTKKKGDSVRISGTQSLRSFLTPKNNCSHKYRFNAMI
jgi:2-oxoglutarate dehydrogenase E2 component (dihydrolipoamide succinyltransferase)